MRSKHWTAVMCLLWGFADVVSSTTGHGTIQEACIELGKSAMLPVPPDHHLGGIEIRGVYVRECAGTAGRKDLGQPCLETFQPAYTHTLKETCDGRRRCDVDTASLGTHARVDMTTSLLVKYTLGRAQVSEVLKCYGGHFTEQLCFSDTTIEVTGAWYGVSQCHSNYPCCPHDDDCLLPVAEHNPTYYWNITDLCNGRTQCAGLQAQRIDKVGPLCPSGLPVTAPSDYVTLQYVCLTDAERRSTAVYSTAPTTNPSITQTTASTTEGVFTAHGSGKPEVTSTEVPTENTTERQVEGAGKMGAIIGIVVATVAAVALVVGLTLGLQLRKRKAKTESATRGDDVTAYSETVPEVTAEYSELGHVVREESAYTALQTSLPVTTSAQPHGGTDTVANMDENVVNPTYINNVHTYENASTIQGSHLTATDLSNNLGRHYSDESAAIRSPGRRFPLGSATTGTAVSETFVATETRAQVPRGHPHGSQNATSVSQETRRGGDHLEPFSTEFADQPVLRATRGDCERNAGPGTYETIDLEGDYINVSTTNNNTPKAQ